MRVTEFLLARIAEDEAVARAAADANGATWTASEGARGGGSLVLVPKSTKGYDGGLWDSEGGYLDAEPASAAHIARNDPARVLAECKAKRRIVEEYLNLRSYHTPTHDTAADGLAVALYVMAYIYSDHPDYNPDPEAEL